MSEMYRYIALFLFLFPLKSFAVAENKEVVMQNCLEIHNLYIDQAYTLTKNCVGLTAPISGRAYGYFSVGIYESSVGIVPNDLQSLEGVLNNYKRTVPEVNTDFLIWELVANTVDYELLKHFYSNSPPVYLETLEIVHDSINIQFKKAKKKYRKLSVEYGKSIAARIIAWSEEDGAQPQLTAIYDEKGPETSCASCWQSTFPGYLPAMLPEWGTVRPMLKKSLSTTDTMQIFPFDIDSSSFMYKEAMLVWECGQLEDPELEIVAEYWDDGTGRSGTPAGHYFSIAKQLTEQQKLSLPEAVLLYARLGVAINDAFIASFKLKYQFYFIRPITYIHRHIDNSFNTRISTPPFPEYPSGHSFQAGAASEVMKSIFGDRVVFTDHTHASRTDIDGSPRDYQSISEMAEEVSISRFYGGIHYRETLDRSLEFGRKLGRFVAESF